MFLADTSTPIVIIGSYHHGSLGIARSLGRLGVGIYGIDRDMWAPSLHSRYFREKLIWDIDVEAPEATVQYLLEVAKRIGKRSILVPTTDESAILLADYDNVLSERYVFPHLSPQLVRALASKKQMYFLAKKNGIPTPETYFPQSREDVDKYLEQDPFPIMLKGIYGSALQRRAGRKMFIIKSKKELLDLYDRYEDKANPNFMLQEYIPGGDDSIWMFNGYFDERSECLFAITGKKIRQAPPHNGLTSLGICLRNDTVHETTKRFMKNIGYKGILDIGYRYDTRDGKYKVLDINPRIGCTFRLFVGDNGLDVARAQYLDLTEQNVPPSQIVEGRKWFVEDYDMVSSVRYYSEKNLTFREWIKSFRGVQEAAWFACDDLLPFFFMCETFPRSVISYMIGHARS
jgi:predicted ATP-grasp superfamily ATP-dependent carboligase